MADLVNFVDYEEGVPVDILWPPHTENAGEPTGIVWWVRNSECDAAEALAAKHAREIQMEQLAAQSGVVDNSGAAARREREKIAACVSRWDWGPHTFEDGKIPECNFDGVMEVLSKQKWFYSDPYKAIHDIRNFTKGGKTTSVKPSRSKSGTTPKTTTKKPDEK